MKGLRGVYALLLAAASTLPANASPSSRPFEPVVQEEPRSRRNAEAPEDEPVRRVHTDSPHMIPTVHPHLNKRDPTHLHSKRTAQLFYTQDGAIYLHNAAMVATLDAMFNWETVILDHTDYVANVKCIPKQMNIQLNDIQSFNAAKANWTHDDTIVFVSSSPSCHTKFPGQFGYFNTSSITFDQKSLTAAAVGTQISVKDAVAAFDIVWGQWDEMGQPGADGSAARVNNNAVVSSTARSSSTTSRRSTTSSTTKKSSTTTKKSTTTTKKATTTTKKVTTTTKKPTTTTTTKKTTTTTKKTTTTTARATTTANRAAAGTTTSSRRSSTSTSRASSSGSSSRSSSSGSSSRPFSSGSSARSSSSGSSSTSRSSTSTTQTAQSLRAGFSSSSSSSSSGSSTTTTTTGFGLVAPTGTGICGVPPKPIPSPFSPYFEKLKCDGDFDEAADDFLTYLSDVANLQQYLNRWAPNTGIQAADVQAGGMRRRGSIVRRYSFGEFLSDVVDVIVSAVNAIIDAAAAALDAIRDLAESILPTWRPSVSFGVPVNVSPPDFMLDESPWGDAFPIYEWTPDGGELNYGLNLGSLAKMTGADQIVLFEIDGVTQLPEPGIKLWCVDCGVRGRVVVTGQATFTFPFGITNLVVKMDGDLTANMGIGLDAFAEYTAELFSVRVFEIGIPGFFIPEIITVGPYVSLDIDANLKIEAVGQFLASAEMHWERIGITVDFLFPILSKGRGFAPQIEPKFLASGNVTATASIGIPLGLNIGVNIFDGEWEAAIALVDRPAIQAVAIYSPVGDTIEEDGLDPCNGILYYANLINEVELNIFDAWKYDLGKWEGDKFLSGCVGDNGVTTVREALQARPAGQTQAGCNLITQSLGNPSFENDGGGGNYSPWKINGGGANIGPTDDANMHDGEVALQWTNHWERDCGSLCGSSCGFTVLGARFCYGCCKPSPRSWEAEVFQEVSMCTYAQYNFQMYTKLVNAEGVCKVTEIFVNNLDDDNPNLSIVVPVDINILPTTEKNKNGQPIKEKGFGFPVALPATNNKANYKVEIGFRAKCENMVNFDIRFDDITLEPDDSAFGSQKRRQLDGTTTPSTTSNSLEAIPAANNALPAIPFGTVAPALTPVNAAPGVAITKDLPNIPAANAAPTLAPNNNAPALSHVSQANLFTGTYTVGAAVPTANAIQLGPADYKFPPFSKIMEKATLGVGAGGASPTGSPTIFPPLTGWSALSALNGTGKLAAADDGNLYLSSGAAGVPLPGTKFYSEKSIAFKDEQNRLFHYYPETMAAYGVSRLRLSTVMETPLTAQLITLVPVDTPSGIAYLAADTARHNYYLTTCTAPTWTGEKVFLVSDLTMGPQKLLSGAIQWIVTGSNVTACQPLVLTAQAGGLTPVDG